MGTEVVCAGAGNVWRLLGGAVVWCAWSLQLSVVKSEHQR